MNDPTGIYNIDLVSGISSGFNSIATGIVTDIGLFASGFYNNLNQPSGISVAYISGWLGANIGQLNVAIEASYIASPESGMITPAMGTDEVAIYELMFNQKYYTIQINNNLGASAYDWSEISEGDSRIRRVSKNEIAKTYKTLLDSTKEDTIRLYHQYRKNKAKPVSVTGDDDVFGTPLFNPNFVFLNYPYFRYYYYWRW